MTASGLRRYLRKRFRRFRCREPSERLSASVGFALFPEDAAGMRACCCEQIADLNMYGKKTRRRQGGGFGVTCGWAVVPHSSTMKLSISGVPDGSERNRQRQRPILRIFASL